MCGTPEATSFLSLEMGVAQLLSWAHIIAERLADRILSWTHGRANMVGHPAFNNIKMFECCRRAANKQSKDDCQWSTEYSSRFPSAERTSDARDSHPERNVLMEGQRYWAYGMGNATGILQFEIHTGLVFILNGKTYRDVYWSIIELAHVRCRIDESVTNTSRMKDSKQVQQYLSLAE
ncbi:hypothetical protein CEXT_709821 [Caerostris extrusa]|uniref:Transposase n=1 Tax=Caerostris extrusa TaxID=172846 RepID=A0AAV4M317_CAEEX|nr:hypothetical protein CEXT_709821 [Caerostris extrusa]